jgi:uncharacterized protein YbjT (DUF2867 family)
MYVITGSTGNTGSVVAEKILGAGKKVRVIGRDAKRMERFRQKGADIFVADASDASAMQEALTGYQAVYAMIPPDNTASDYRVHQEEISDALAAGIAKSGIPNVVSLSSFGADKPHGTGPVAGLHSFENKLNAIAGVNVLHLRAGYFMENLLPQVGVIQSFGMVAGPVRADLPLGMIATRDIGDYAAAALLQLTFKGKSTRELLGSRDVSYNEIATIIGKAIGKPGLTYRQLPAVQLKPALLAMGMSASITDLLLEMADALNSGYMKPLEPRSAENTTPTTIESFIAGQFAPAFRAKTAGA